jgi:hypothetical protein
MKTSRLFTISDDLSLVLSIERLESLNDHYVFTIKTMDGDRQFENKLKITMDTQTTTEFFECLEKIKCAM